MPLSYVTGTLVKMGQGIERHIAGGDVSDWLGYFLLFVSFIAGRHCGWGISLVVNGTGCWRSLRVVRVDNRIHSTFHHDPHAALLNSLAGTKYIGSSAGGALLPMCWGVCQVAP